MNTLQRCAWCTSDPLYLEYHDTEWGVALHDELKLFEMLYLEGMQAGLSWLTILKRRHTIRAAFAHFNPEALINFTEADVAKLMQNPGIIRNRLKVAAVIQNAQAYLELKKQHNFNDFIWQFVDQKPIVNHWSSLKEIPTETEISKHMSKTLKKAGFRFVGPTICYAFMQAVGMVNDHTIDCFLHALKN
jgi:DNA-3-methyladenine glycosylase I